MPIFSPFFWSCTESHFQDSNFPPNYDYKQSVLCECELRNVVTDGRRAARRARNPINFRPLICTEVRARLLDDVLRKSAQTFNYDWVDPSFHLQSDSELVNPSVVSLSLGRMNPPILDTPGNWKCEYFSGWNPNSSRIFNFNSLCVNAIKKMSFWWSGTAPAHHVAVSLLAEKSRCCMLDREGALS